jgi:hypothetical protein
MLTGYGTCGCTAFKDEISLWFPVARDHFVRFEEFYGKAGDFLAVIDLIDGNVKKT